MYRQVAWSILIVAAKRLLAQRGLALAVLVRSLLRMRLFDTIKLGETV